MLLKMTKTHRPPLPPTGWKHGQSFNISPRTFAFLLYCLPAARPQALSDERGNMLYFHVLTLFFLDACGDPPRYQSMKLKGVAQPLYRPGAIIEYECRLGYRLKRPPLPTSARCQADNTWTPLQEACRSKSTKHFWVFLNYSGDIHTFYGTCSTTAGFLMWM